MPEKITMQADGTLSVPDEPIIPFVEESSRGFRSSVALQYRSH